MYYRSPTKRREKGEEKFLEEIIARNIPNVREEIDIHVQEAQRVPSKINLKRPTPRYILIKMSKLKTKREY